MEQRKDFSGDNEMALLWNDAVTLVGFVGRSVKRHRIIAIAVFCAVIGLSVVMLLIMPRTYETGARILTNPGQSLLQLEPYVARQSATELITSRENLLAVIEENKLKERWESTRTSIGRIKDQVLTAIFGEEAQGPDDERLTLILLFMLKNKIMVNMSQQVIEIGVQWHDAETSFLIAKTLVRRFLDDQYERENAEYLVNIANLKKRLKLAEVELKFAEKQYKETLKKDDASSAKRSSSNTSSRSSIAVSAPKSDVESSASKISREEREEMEEELAMKKREIEMLENNYLQRLGEAKNRLAELKTTLGPRHPEVVKQERLVSLLTSPPPSLKTLRAEKDELAARLKQATSASSKSTSRRRSRRPSRRTGSSSSSSSSSSSPSTESEFASAEQEELFLEYQQARDDRNRLAGDLANAKIEYEAGKAALDLRYKVSQPPIFPTGPIKPNPKKILIAALVVGLILGIFLAVFVDIRSGILLESWQVSRMMGIPILGEMDDPSTGGVNHWEK